MVNSFNEMEIDENMSIERNNFEEEDEELNSMQVSKEEAMMQIFVQTMNGRTITIRCRESDTVWIIKQKICDKEGYPLQGQRILWAGKQLRDEKTLRFYCIHKEATLHLVFRLPGGRLQREDVETGEGLFPFFIDD
eukprot:UN02614